MANLGTWYSGTGEIMVGQYAYTTRLKVDLLSQNPATNTSVIRYTSAVYWDGKSWLLSNTLYDTCAGVVLYNAPFQMDFPAGQALRYCIVRDRTITHDANGNASFTATHQWGGSVSASYTLPKINRDAYITNTPNFTVGSNVNVQIFNPASYHLWLDFYTWNGSSWEPRVMTRSIGGVTSFTTDFSPSEINAIYSQLQGATTGTGLFRIRAYSGDTLVSQRDKQVTLTVDVSQTEAYITNTPDFVVGNNPTLQIHNPRNYWLKLDMYVNGSTGWEPVVLFGLEIGQVSSYTTAFTQPQINAIYSQMKDRISSIVKFRIRSHADSSYSIIVGGSREKDATVTINTAVNNPTFTNYDLVSEDKTITVKDSYNNTLATTTTNTLTGSNQKFIQGVSQAKVSITSANKMVAKNQADPVRYRFVNGEKLVEASYKASETVNLLIDNITSKDAVVSAYDSRGLATAVTKSFTNIANYTPPTAWSLAFVRDNNVDAKTKLSIGGKFWKQYFGGGTSGVQNTITAHYRYKETTASWGSQTWNTLAVASNAEGDISFNNYINGDLGVNGFNKDKSYSVEVRLYDKISALIVSGVLNKGTPLLDWTIDGVAIKDKYNPLIGGSLQVDGRSLLDWIHPVGTIYTTTSSALDTVAKMNAYFGGTWEAYGSGRTLVAISGDAEFNTIDKEIGTKTHILSASEMQHTNYTNRSSGIMSAGGNWGVNADESGWIATVSATGHNNIQPSKVVCRYRRIA